MEIYYPILEREMKNLSSTIFDILSKLSEGPIYVHGIFELFKIKEKEEYMIEILKCIYEHTPEFYEHFLSIRDTHQNTLLLKACIERKQEVVKYILNTWKMIPNHKNSDGLNAFIYCCRNKYEDEAMTILDKGEMDILTIDPLLNCTPIMYACSHKMRNVIRRILTMGPCNLSVPSKTGVTPIMVACQNGLFEECVVMYASGEANIGNVCKQNNTLLNTACNMGFEELAFKIINDYSIEDCKAELKHKDGDNPLSNAIHHRMWGVSLMLIHKNYDLNMTLKDGDNFLIIAAFKGLEDIAMEIALRKPELITWVNEDNCTPLIMACDKKCVKLAHYLLDHGDCLIFSIDKCQETALMIACKNGLESVAMRILEIPCHTHNFVNTYHESALYWAVKMNLKNVYEKLFSLYSFHSSNVHDKKILELLLQTKNYEYQKIILEKMTIRYLQDKIEENILEVEEPVPELKIEDFEEEVEEKKTKKNKKKKKNQKKDSPPQKVESIHIPFKEELIHTPPKEEPIFIPPMEEVKEVYIYSPLEELIDSPPEEQIRSHHEEVLPPLPVFEDKIDESNLYAEPPLPIIEEEEKKPMVYTPMKKKENKKKKNQVLLEEKKHELYVPPNSDPNSSRLLNHTAVPFQPRVKTPSPTKDVVMINHLPPLAPPTKVVKKEKEVKEVVKPPTPIKSVRFLEEETNTFFKPIKTLEEENQELLNSAYLPPSLQIIEEMRQKYLQQVYKNRVNYTNIHYWYQEIFMKVFRTVVPSNLFNDISFIRYRINPMGELQDWYKIEYLDIRDNTGLYVFQYII